MQQLLTPELFDTLVLAVIIIGAAWAGVRLYRDFTRPLRRIDRHDVETRPMPRVTRTDKDTPPS